MSDNNSQLSQEILNHLARGVPNPRLVALLAQGSKPNLNELCRAILAQDEFKTTDSKAIAAKNLAIKLSSREEPVIVRGESGTGKELIAQILHGSRSGNFVAVNVTAVTDSLFESELFGHVKGSFTGAITDRAGLVAHASNGTLFFDEIGDMPLALQPKILRLLQSRKFRMVGGNTDQIMNCRVIAATHTNLEQLVEEKKFRLDLYHRLTCFQITIPPLRARLEDLKLFTQSEPLLAKLQQMPLYGNVREVENLIKRWEVIGEI